MIHKWQKIDGTDVLMNSNDGRTPLAFINEADGMSHLKIPYLKSNIDLKDTTNALTFVSLIEAKQTAEDEVKRRIDEFVSPGN